MSESAASNRDVDVSDVDIVQECYPLDDFRNQNKLEVEKFLDDIVKNRSLKECVLCPHRTFDRADRLEQHVRLYHKAEREYICSGRSVLCRQFYVAKAIADNDKILKLPVTPSYLRRSAQLINPALDPDASVNDINQEISIALKRNGPAIVSARAAKSSMRQCGDFFCD